MADIKDFQILDLNLPEPSTATIFGVNLILHFPSNIFPYLISLLPQNFNPESIAALSESIPRMYAPTTFKNVFNQSLLFFQDSHECIQYKDDSVIFLMNAFPELEIEFILDTLANHDSDLLNTGITLNKNYKHVKPNKDSEAIEILNPYASYQISTLLAHDDYIQNSPSHRPNINSNLNETFENSDDAIQFRINSDDRRQISEDASLAYAIQMEDEERYEQEKREKSLEDEYCALVLQHHLEEEEEYERKIRKEAENMVECSCCFCEVPFGDMVQCPEGHLTCRSCIEKSIETALGEGQVRTDCPAVGCTTKITLDELERVLPPHLMKRLDETEAYNAFARTEIEGLYTCWKCGYRAIDENEEGPFECTNCGERTCKKCGKKFHENRSCEEADLDPERIVENRMLEAIVRQCPNCKTQFIKNEGCNHMTCPRCKTEFCYLCGEVITGNVSEHYKTCKQFMDNDKYNAEQIRNAEMKAKRDLNLPQ